MALKDRWKTYSDKRGLSPGQESNVSFADKDKGRKGEEHSD